jgi:hypothetical protein
VKPWLIVLMVVLVLALVFVVANPKVRCTVTGGTWIEDYTSYDVGPDLDVTSTTTPDRCDY